MQSVCIWYFRHDFCKSIQSRRTSLCLVWGVCGAKTHQKLWGAGIYATSLSIAIMVFMKRAKFYVCVLTSLYLACHLISKCLEFISSGQIRQAGISFAVRAVGFDLDSCDSLFLNTITFAVLKSFKYRTDDYNLHSPCFNNCVLLAENTSPFIFTVTLFQMLVRVKHVPHFCRYTTGEETFAIYIKRKRKFCTGLYP